MDPAGSQGVGKFTELMDSEEQVKVFSGFYSDFPGNDKDTGFLWPAGKEV